MAKKAAAKKSSAKSASKTASARKTASAKNNASTEATTETSINTPVPMFGTTAPTATGTPVRDILADGVKATTEGGLAFAPLEQILPFCTDPRGALLEYAADTTNEYGVAYRATGVGMHVHAANEQARAAP